MKTLAIIGGGELGEQIAHLALVDKHYSEVVFFDDYIKETDIKGHKVLGNTNKIIDAYNEKKFDELVIGIGYNHMYERKKFFEKYISLIPFGNIIHSSTIIDPTVKLGKGIIIYPGCIFDKGVELKNNILINIGNIISHDCILRSHSFFAPRVSLAGFVEIGEQCILGISSTVIDNLKITNRVQLGGSTLVLKNIQEPGLYVGNPARIIRPNNERLRDIY